MSAYRATPTIGTMLGDWRRRAGTTTDAHLYGPQGHATRWPVCNRRIPRARTVIAPKSARPCYECLAQAASGRA